MLLLVLIHPAEARIGETQERCRERYGKPVGINQQGRRVTALYLSDGFVVNAVFWDDRAFSITYQKLGPDNEPVALTESQMVRLLDINFGKHQWQGSTASGGWFTEDLRLGGHIDAATHTYTVMDMGISYQVSKTLNGALAQQPNPPATSTSAE